MIFFTIYINSWEEFVCLSFIDWKIFWCKATKFRMNAFTYLLPHEQDMTQSQFYRW